MEHRNTIINYVRNNFKLFFLLFLPLIVSHILEATQNTDSLLFTILFIYRLILSGIAFILIGLPFGKMTYKLVAPKLEGLRKMRIKSKNLFFSKAVLIYLRLVNIFYILIPITFSITLLLLIFSWFDIELSNTYFNILPILTILLIPYIFDSMINIRPNTLFDEKNWDENMTYSKKEKCFNAVLLILVCLVMLYVCRNEHIYYKILVGVISVFGILLAIDLVRQEFKEER